MLQSSCTAGAWPNTWQWKTLKWTYSRTRFSNRWPSYLVFYTYTISPPCLAKSNAIQAHTFRLRVANWYNIFFVSWQALPFSPTTGDMAGSWLLWWQRWVLVFAAVVTVGVCEVLISCTCVCAWHRERHCAPLQMFPSSPVLPASCCGPLPASH